LAISQTVNPNPATGVSVSQDLVFSKYVKTTTNKVLTRERVPANIPPGTYSVVGTKSRGANTVFVTLRSADDDVLYSLYLPTTEVSVPQMLTLDKPVTSVTYNYSWQGWPSRTQAFSTTVGNLNALTYGNGVFVAAGTADLLFGVQTSSDGVTWTVRLASGTGTAFALAYGRPAGSPMYVVAGSAGVIWSSFDSNSWFQRTSPVGNNILNAATYGNNLFIVAGAAGVMATSTDGTTWISRTPGFGVTPINALTFGNNTYVAGGDNGRLSTSTDGLTWTTRDVGFGSTSVLSLTYGNGIFIAGGNAGLLSTSTDGITWTSRFSNFATTPIRALTYADGLFLLGGDGGALRVSTDGADWDFRNNTLGSTGIRALTFGYGIGIFGAPTAGLAQVGPPPVSFPPANNLPGGVIVVGGSNGAVGSRIHTSEQGFQATFQVYRV
jgi:hypothetical protein